MKKKTKKATPAAATKAPANTSAVAIDERVIALMTNDMCLLRGLE